MSVCVYILVSKIDILTSTQFYWYYAESLVITDTITCQFVDPITTEIIKLADGSAH